MKFLLLILTLFISFKTYSNTIYEDNLIIKKGETYKSDKMMLDTYDKLIVYGTLKIKGDVFLKDNAEIIIKDGGTLKVRNLQFNDNSSGKFQENSIVEIDNFITSSLNTTIVHTTQFSIKNALKSHGTIIEGMGRITLTSGLKNFIVDNGGTVLVCVGSEKWKINQDCDLNRSVVYVPEEYSTISINVRDNKVFLIWKSEKEINNTHFKVEYSRDGTNYTLIEEFIVGVDKKEGDYGFEVMHSTIYGGKTTYRLIQEDFEGNQMIYHKNVFFKKL